LATLALGIITFLNAGCRQEITWLPDSRRIAYLRDSAVWIVTIDGKTGRIFEIPVADDDYRYLVAAPVGNRLALQTQIKDEGRSSLTILTDSGKVSWTITLEGAEREAPRWSKSGGLLLAAPKEASGSLVIDLSANILHRIDIHAKQILLSDDGNLLAYQVDDAHKARLDVYQLDGTKVRSEPWPALPAIDNPETFWIENDENNLWIFDKTKVAEDKEGNDPDPRKISVVRLARKEGTAVRVTGQEAIDYIKSISDEKTIQIAGQTVDLESMCSRMKGLDTRKEKEAKANDSDSCKGPDAIIVSPDGKSGAKKGKHGIYLGDLATGQVKVLVTW